DLLGRGQRARDIGLRPFNLRSGRLRLRKLASPHGHDPARSADLLFLGGERQRFVARTTSLIRKPTRGRVKRQDVAVARILDGLLALHHMESDADGLVTKYIAQPIAADKYKLQAD